MRAHQIMTHKVLTVTTDTAIVDAANVMLQNHISGLPVINEAGNLVGVVSQSDFIRRAEIGTQCSRGRWLKFIVGPGGIASDFVHERGRKVGEIMTPDPVTVTEDTPLDKIVLLMERHGIKRLPVMRSDQLVGIVTRTNLLQAVAGLARDVPDPTADDATIFATHILPTPRSKSADWAPFGLGVVVNQGVVHLSGVITNERCREAAIVRRGERLWGETGSRPPVLGRCHVRDVSQLSRRR